MKKIITSLALIGLSTVTILASPCNPGEQKVQKGNHTFCVVSNEQKTERICVGDFSMNPDDPTGTQCIKKPIVISNANESTYSCPNGSTSINSTTCVKTEPMKAISIDKDMIGGWHAFASRNSTKLKLEKESGTVLTEMSSANSALPHEMKDIECNEQVYLNGILNNPRYGVFGHAGASDLWELHFAKIYDKDGKKFLANEPYKYEFKGGHFPVSDGSGTYPKKIVPTNSFVANHSYYIFDDWDKLSEPTDIATDTVATDGFYQQVYTYNLLTATLRMGITGAYDWARGNADNPYLTDKGYIYDLRRALVQMNPGDWIYSQNTAGEAGECWKYKALPDQKDIVSISCGATGSGIVNISFTRPKSNCGNMLSTTAKTTESYTATLSCCQTMGDIDYPCNCSSCVGSSDPACEFTCSTCTKWGCTEYKDWTTTKAGRNVWKAWTREPSSYRKSDITITDSNCDKVNVKKPNLQNDICVPENNWDSLEGGSWNHCSSTLKSTYYYHKDGAKVPSYCSNVGVNKCGALTLIEQGSDFAYCSSDPVNNPTPQIGYWVDNVRWWGWNKNYSTLGITKSDLKAEFKGAIDAHYQCQKEMCDNGFETCKAANDTQLAAELKAQQELWEKTGNQGFGEDGSGGALDEGSIDVGDTSFTNSTTVNNDSGTATSAIPAITDVDKTESSISFGVALPK